MAVNKSAASLDMLIPRGQGMNAVKLPGSDLSYHAQRPVLHEIKTSGWADTGPGCPAIDAVTFRRIVVALDGSAAAEEILPVVARLSRAFGSHVTLLQVVVPAQPSVYAGGGLPHWPRTHDANLLEISKHARVASSAYLSVHRDQLKSEGVDATYVAREGSASTGILDYARSVGADLIAMTTYGRGGLGRLVFGSVAEAVLRSAPCPVLMVRVQDA